jgi:hypothetical protein
MVHDIKANEKRVYDSWEEMRVILSTSLLFGFSSLKLCFNRRTGTARWRPIRQHALL